MPAVIVTVRIADEHFRAYEAEAARQGIAVEALIQQTVNCLMEELEAEENECERVLMGRKAPAGSTPPP